MALEIDGLPINKGGPENPKAKRQQTNLSNTDNWFISFSPLASFFLEDEHYGRIHCKFHFSPPARWGVVRFYQGCSPRLAVLLVLVLLLLVLRLLLLPPPPVSPRSCLHQLPPQLPPCQLFAKLFANFPAQCAPLDLNLGPNQLVWDLNLGPGPQSGTFPAQCAPLDLNLGPSQLCVHCWTSTAR